MSGKSSYTALICFHYFFILQSKHNNIKERSTDLGFQVAVLL